MGGSSKKATVGYRYFLGMHMVLCHGPIDQITRIGVDKRQAWMGVNTGDPIDLDAEDLFGGEGREGGVSGTVDVEMGGPLQTVNSYLQAKVFGHVVPAYRGVVSLVLRHLYIGTNPYIKPWEVRAQRVFTRQNGQSQWYPDKAAIRAAGVSKAIGAFVDEFKPPLNVWRDLPAFAPTKNGLLIQGGQTLEFANEIDLPAFDKIEMQFRWTKLPDNKQGGITITFSDDYRDYVYRWQHINETQTINTWEAESVPEVGGEVGLPNLNYPYFTHVHYSTPTNLGYNLGRISGGANETYIPQTRGGSLRIQIKVDPGSAIEFLLLQVNRTDTLQYSEQDMNPAHIIRECLTDPAWGMGYPESDIDDVSFAAVADTLHSEGMGISLLWEKQTAIEDFVQEILTHIDGNLYVDRTTGKFVLSLIRDDYDPANLLVLDESHIKSVRNVKRPAVGDLVNSITVNYWDSASGDDASLTVQDQALVQIQGGSVNSTIQYPGFTNATIAAKAAMRDLQSLSSALMTCELVCTREAEILNIGSPFVLDWPALQISGLVMRVKDISFGDARNNEIVINAIEDVFSFPDQTVVSPPTKGVWTDPLSIYPKPADPRLVAEAPYRQMVLQEGQPSVDAMLVEDPSTGFLMIAAARQKGEINALIQVNSGAGYGDAGILDFSPAGTVATQIGPTDTLIVLSDAVDLDRIAPGSAAQIGSELVRVDAVNEVTAELTIGRGIMDTVPQSHASGEDVIVWEDFVESDEIAYVAGETVSVKLQPSTASKTLDFEDAPEDSVVFASRAIRPYPPANVEINGEHFPVAVGAPLQIAWSHRDRILQTDGYLWDWFAESIGPEPGVSYLLSIFSEDGGELVTDTVSGEAQYSLDIETEKTALNKPAAPPSGIYSIASSIVVPDPFLGFVFDSSPPWTDSGVTLSGSATIDAGGMTGYASSNASSALMLGGGDFSISTRIQWTHSTFATVLAIRNPILILITVSRISPGDISAETWDYVDADNRVRTSTAFNDGQPHDVVVTFNAANRELKLYVDGQSRDARLQPGQRPGVQSTNLYVGGNDKNNQLFNAPIAHTRLYDRLLTESEIGGMSGLSAVTNFDLHLDSSTLNPPDGQASSWNDAESGISATQISAANQPAIIADAIAGYPALRFTGSQWLDLSAANSLIQSADRFAMLVVALVGEGGDAYGGVVGATVNTSNNTRAGIYESGASIEAGFRTTDAGTYLSATLAGITGWRLLVADFDYAAGATTLKNAGVITQTTFTATQFPASAPQFFEIGRIASGFAVSADIADIILLRNFSDDDLATAEGYLAHKFGLQSQLPSNHPHKNAAPNLGGQSAELRLNANLRVVLESQRDGYVSWQRFDHSFGRSGYGFNYGNFGGGL